MAYNERGIVYYKQSNYDKAIADFTEALKKNLCMMNVSWITDSYVARGLTFYKEENYSSAMSDYFSALKINPTHKEAIRHLASMISDEFLDKDRFFSSFQSLSEKEQYNLIKQYFNPVTPIGLVPDKDYLDNPVGQGTLTQKEFGNWYSKKQASFLLFAHSDKTSKFSVFPREIMHLIGKIMTDDIASPKI